jgi:FlaG/FlaF family flagellin (archaellin)
MVALQIAIVFALFGTISAFILPLEYNIDKQGEKQQSGNLMKGVVLF